LGHCGTALSEASEVIEGPLQPHSVHFSLTELPGSPAKSP